MLVTKSCSAAHQLAGASPLIRMVLLLADGLRLLDVRPGQPNGTPSERMFRYAGDSKTNQLRMFFLLLSSGYGRLCGKRCTDGTLGVRSLTARFSDIRP